MTHALMHVIKMLERNSGYKMLVLYSGLFVQALFLLIASLCYSNTFRGSRRVRLAATCLFTLVNQSAHWLSLLHEGQAH
jgi:hypothetical protein